MGKTALLRQDIVLGVGRSQSFGVTWKRTGNPDLSGAAPFDYAGYEGEFRISSEHGELWLASQLVFDSGTGLVAGYVEPSDTAGPAWLARATGRYAFVVTGPDGEVTVPLAGIVRITQEGY